MLQLVKSPSFEVVVQPGDVLEGRYRLQRLIGEGGMGTVFLAEHVLIKRRVAIKVLHTDLAGDAEVIERFMNEARAAGTLGHPNIVESTDMGFARGDVPYIVFEYLEGTLLSDEVYRLGGLSARRALKIAHQMASALQAAHRAGIIHRDLKTDNVFLTDKDDALDHVKVLDFGISRFLEAEQSTSRGGQRRSMVMGTPEFMAPEQITAPESVDARTDIYALGVVLYEMLAARTPFVSQNPSDPHELMHRILLDRPPPLSRPGLPAGLADMIVDKLLAKDPATRYQSMGDVQGALEAFISVVRRDTQPAIAAPVVDAVVETTAAKPAPVASLQPVLPAVPKRRRGWLWLAAAFVAIAAGTGVMMLAEPQTSPGTPDITALEREATQIASALDAEASAAQLRAEGVATSPMLRAAIETDRATLADMARDGSVFSPQPGEVFEIFQQREAQPLSLLRIPATATPLPPMPDKQARLVADAGTLRLVVGTPVTRTSGAVGGSLALAVPIDAHAFAPARVPHVSGVRLVGAGIDITLAPHSGEGREHTIAVPTKLAQLSLVAVVASPTVTLQPQLLPAYACFGAGALFLLLFVVGLVVRR